VDRIAVADHKRESQRILKRSVARAESHAGLAVTAESREGYPPDVLASLADSAGLIVVGSQHLHAVGRVVMGSVSSSLVARAPCPVVVLAAPSGFAGENPSVIVGVTGTEDDERVLEFAFTQASRHGRRLRALYFWHPPFADTSLPPPPRAQAWLSESLAGWRERYPDVPLRSSVVREHPVHGLVAASASQDLLVVGRHSRRAHLGALLGSVSLGVLHHATCPVAVVPTGER
jgi:nucleotide-binding universal stress UspA family protein